MYPVGHFGFVPVTLMVLPFLTQVIVFFALFAVGDAEAIGDFEALGVGVGVELGDGVGVGVGSTEFVAKGVGVAVATAAAVGNLSMS